MTDDERMELTPPRLTKAVEALNMQREADAIIAALRRKEPKDEVSDQQQQD
jgi:hypothetical protein